MWRAYTESVTPLKNRAPVPAVGIRHQEPVRPVRPRGDGCPRRGKPTGAGVVAREDLVRGNLDGLDRRAQRRFRRGKLPIEARLDLHGHTRMRAKARLDRFIEAAWRDGKRCVMVITGKGGARWHDPSARSRETGVLRRDVPIWLNDSRNRPRILAFTHAQPGDGGEGALYIMIRRRRE